MDHGAHNHPYRQLALMAIAHLVAMFVLMYAMVDVVGNAIPNLNQAYMAVLMAAPMVILEISLMRDMYPSKRTNLWIVIGTVVIFVGSFFLIRNQTAINDTEFLRSMIPHHAGAILMCENASINDEQIRELCANIILNQQAEIDWMRAKLKAIDTK